MCFLKPQSTMSRKESIKNKLKVLNPEILEVLDVSDQHKGHIGNPDGKGQTHYEIIITASTLSNNTKLKQHRIINDLLKEEFANGLHSVSIKIAENK